MFSHIRIWANKNEGFIGLISMIIAIAGLVSMEGISVLLSRIAPPAAAFFRQYGGVALWAGLLVFCLNRVVADEHHRLRLARIEERIQILENRPTILLDSETALDLNTWSFADGRWDSDRDGLSVTCSDFGGICKSGATWENYEFSFEFKIMNKCAAWIVRALSDESYFMIQCNERQICPHLFGVVRNQTQAARVFEVVNRIDHRLTLAEWNKVRTKVVGHSIKVWINDTLVWSSAVILKDFPMGTVGFRDAGDEHALFRQIRVVSRQVESMPI